MRGEVGGGIKGLGEGVWSEGSLSSNGPAGREGRVV